MSRVLVFETITDNRFDENVIALCEERAEKIESLLSALPGVKCKAEPMTMPHFADGTQQARIKFFVTKEGRKTTWNDVYKTVNSVKASVYKFIN